MRLAPTATVSMRTPPSLRPRPGPSSSHKSLGHFSPSRGGSSAEGSSASASASPTASDSPDQSAGDSGSESEKVSEAPALACQSRPSRPRPRVWCSATSRQGWVSPARRPWGDAGPGSPPSSSGAGRVAAVSRWPPDWRARSSSRVFVESSRATTSTLRPGSSGSSCCHSASAPQLRWPVSAITAGGAWAPASCAGSSGCRSGTRRPSSASACSARRSPGRSRRTALRRAAARAVPR